MIEVPVEKRTTAATLFLVVVILVAAYLRFNNLTKWSMWLDEAYSTFGAEQSYRFIWTVLPTYETHPPFYTTILHSWVLIAGSSTYAVRFFGAMIGMLSLVAIWHAARALAANSDLPRFTLALPSVLLASVLPSFVDIARLVRPYNLIILVYAVGVWAVLRLALSYRTDATLARGPWFTYLICLALLFWLHNLGAFYAAALGLGLLFLIGQPAFLRISGRQFLVGHALVALAVAPAFLMMLDQAPTWAKTTWLRFDLSLVPWQLPIIFGLDGFLGITIAALLAASGFRALGAQRARLAGALLLMTFVPIAFSVALSTFVTPVFLIRTLVGCGVPLLLLMAAGVNIGLLQRVSFAILVGISAQHVLQLQHGSTDDDWYPAVKWLAPRLGPQDVVYAYPNEGALPFHYAMRDIGKSVTIRALPSWVPASDPAGWYSSGSRGVQSLPDWRLEQIARDPVSRKTPTIWLLRIQRRIYDRGDSALRTFKVDREEVAHFARGTADIVGLQQSPQPAPPKQAKP